jgi:D-amino-acid dehydrogenase
MITKGIRWMFNASSPFYIKPRFDLDLIRWGLKFMKSCTPEHVQRSMKSILEINLLEQTIVSGNAKNSILGLSPGNQRIANGL